MENDVEAKTGFMEEITPIDVVKITYDDLPETISPVQILLLDFMLEDEK